MEFFVEDNHTSKDWIWVLKHRAIFTVIMLFWFITLYFIVMLVLLTQRIIANRGILIISGILLFFLGFFGLGQILGSLWDIRKAIWRAKRQRKSINIKYENGNQIIRIAK